MLLGRGGGDMLLKWDRGVDFSATFARSHWVKWSFLAGQCGWPITVHIAAHGQLSKAQTFGIHCQASTPATILRVKSVQNSWSCSVTFSSWLGSTYDFHLHMYIILLVLISTGPANKSENFVMKTDSVPDKKTQVDSWTAGRPFWFIGWSIRREKHEWWTSQKSVRIDQKFSLNTFHHDIAKIGHGN